MLQENKKHFYVFIRTDLPLCQQLVQSVHAAYEAGIRFQPTPSLTPHSTVVCQVASEKELLKVAHRLKSTNIKLYIFKEPDLNYQATALCSEPVDHILYRKVFCKFKLWKEKEDD